MVLNPCVYLGAVMGSLGGVPQPLVRARCAGGWPALPFQPAKFGEGF